MTEDNERQDQEGGGAGGAQQPASRAHAEHAPLQGADAPSGPHGAEHGRQDGQNGPRGFLRRLTVNEWLTFLVGFGSLVVSYLTYKTAADTSDLKDAVAGLTRLAGEAHDQTAAMQMQARAAQEQLKHMVTAQRAWLLVEGMEVLGMHNFPVGAGIVAFAAYKVSNIGRSPASAISINTKLILSGIDEFSDDTVRSLCRPQLAGYDRLLSDYKDTLLPGQSETIRGFPNAAGMFARSLDGLDEVRDRQNAEGNRRRPARLYVSLILVGCVTCRIVGDDALHETGFAFSARTDPLRTLAIDIDQKGPIPAGPFAIGSTVYGNFAN